MDLIGAVLGYVLSAFLLVMIARVILDWAGVITRLPSWAARGRQLTHATTEPVVAQARRVLPPVRFGGFGIDLAFTVVFFIALILRSVAFAI